MTTDRSSQKKWFNAGTSRRLLLIVVAVLFLFGLPVSAPAGSTDIEIDDYDTDYGEVHLPITNKYNMEFVYISPGEFLMGSPPDESGRQDNERQHKVILTKGFYIMTTEVTQKQWTAVMGDNPSAFSDCGPDCPVESVAWPEVNEFIKTLNEQAAIIVGGPDGEPPANDLTDQSDDPTDQNGATRDEPPGRLWYLLPTEAQWEYACRAGSRGWFYFDGDIWGLNEYAWHKGNAGEQPHPVARKKPNAFGLYDTHGNVWEWCRNYAGPYPKKILRDPSGPKKGLYRIARGGSWFFPALEARSANRLYMLPEMGNYNIGFRLVLTADRWRPPK